MPYDVINFFVKDAVGIQRKELCPALGLWKGSTEEGSVPAAGQVGPGRKAWAFRPPLDQIT